MNKRTLQYSQYIEIQRLKEKGYNPAQACKKLNFTDYSVRKYWNMTKEEFNQVYSESKSAYAKHEEFIVSELKRNPYISSSTILDHLTEAYGKVGGSLAAWFRYMKELRIREGCWRKSHTAREFCTLPDRKPGVEAQVDMGELWMKDFDGEKVKVYFFAMVLSYSRMKYVYFSIEPFNAALFCYAHDRAFRYFGGYPKEIWYDQDKVMVVSENCGDIIFTEDFDSYHKEVAFEIMLCKKQDPDTKGKIENVIRYVKMNFLDSRQYTGIDSLNNACLGWLDRTANGTLHVSTKRVPREMFEEERKYLTYTPPKTINLYRNRIVTVSNTNCVIFRNNRYSIPVGIYHEGDRLRLEEVGKLLQIIDPETTEIIVTHRILEDKGKIAPLKNNGREEKDILNKEMREYLKKEDIFYLFMRKVSEEKPRYVYEQYYMLRRATKKYGDKKVIEAMKICIAKNLYSINDVVLRIIEQEGIKELNKVVPHRASAHYKKQLQGLDAYNQLLEDDKTDG